MPTERPAVLPQPVQLTRGMQPGFELEEGQMSPGAAQADIACELREVNLRAKPETLLLSSPKGTVLVTANGVIEQSLEIMLWALRQNDPDGWLTPTEGSETEMLALINELDTGFKPALDRCKYPERFSAEQVSQAQRQALLWLTALNEQLANTGYLFGNNPSLADMALRPFVRQFARIDEAQWAKQPWPALQAWLQRWIDSALFAEVMQTYPAWREGETGPSFIAAVEVADNTQNKISLR